MIHPKTFLTIAAIAAFPTFIIFSKDTFSNHKNGSFINIESNANGFWEQSGSIWTLNKYSETKNLQLRINDSYNLSYALTIGKEPSGQIDVKGAVGEVCVKNSGGQKTQNLKIENQIQYKDHGNFKDLSGANQITTGKEIDAGKKECIPYKIAFVPPQNISQFRVKSKATVSNFFKKREEEKSTSDTESFKFPSTIQTNQDTAIIADLPECPQNYSCTPTDTGPWNVSAASTINYNVLIKNDAASCSLPVSFKNTATLTENATQTKTSSTNEIPINTGPC